MASSVLDVRSLLTHRLRGPPKRATGPPEHRDVMGPTKWSLCRGFEYGDRAKPSLRNPFALPLPFQPSFLLVLKEASGDDLLLPRNATGPCSKSGFLKSATRCN